MITGHRPARLGGYDPANPKKLALIEKFKLILDRAAEAAKGEALVAISGMALGCDQWWATAAIERGIDVHAYIPFEGQEGKWPRVSQRAYYELLNGAAEVWISCAPGYAAWKMQERNCDMVDNADYCVAVWDRSPSGTGRCVGYAIEKGRPLLVVNPDTLDDRWEDSAFPSSLEVW